VRYKRPLGGRKHTAGLQVGKSGGSGLGRARSCSLSALDETRGIGTMMSKVVMLDLISIRTITLASFVSRLSYVCRQFVKTRTLYTVGCLHGRTSAAHLFSSCRAASEPRRRSAADHLPSIARAARPRSTLSLLTCEDMTVRLSIGRVLTHA
jgi:hypothetical protein